MITNIPPDVPKWALVLLNNLYEMEQKLVKSGDVGNVLRNVNKIKDVIEEWGVFYEDPMGQLFKETRTDLEASISGVGTENLEVVQVIKPIIRIGPRELSRVAQKGIVVVESKSENK
jgi:hypothetical protein